MCHLLFQQKADSKKMTGSQADDDERATWQK